MDDHEVRLPLMDEKSEHLDHPFIKLHATTAGVTTASPARRASHLARPLLVIAALLLFLFAPLSPFGDGPSIYANNHINTPSVPRASLTNVTYDHRSLIINGERAMLIVGTIHYPRSTPTMWRQLLRRSKEAGINTIDTYVFWNVHEEEEGVYDFETEEKNMNLFLQIAQEEGLYIVLRIGPYVCAEWNFGGFPTWLLEKKDMELRSYSKTYMESMEIFVRKTLEVVDHLLFTNGGPIIIVQIENEYGGVEKEFGMDGHRYITWAADLANSLNVGIPWIMCAQDNIPTVINTINGFYTDNWIQPHWARFHDQPAFFTELWTGWFQQYGQGKFVRPATDIAFSVARWVARGGSYWAYYMWHGGTNFGRWGSAWKTASYDYDAPMTEYGYENNPKFQHLKRLHYLIMEYKDEILGEEPKAIALKGTAEAHIYGCMKKGEKGIVFLSNPSDSTDVTVTIHDRKFHIPRWSVQIYTNSGDGLVLAYSTDSPHPTLHATDVSVARAAPETSDLKLAVEPNKITYINEPIPSFRVAHEILADAPLEQVRVTKDSTDYLWYIRPNITLPEEADEFVFRFERIDDVAYVWVDDEAVGSLEGVKLRDTTYPPAVESKGAVELRVPTNSLKSAKAGGKEHTLKIMTAVTGLENCCGHLERVMKGILGGIYLNNKDVTFGGMWGHKVGLEGEKEKYYKPEKHTWIQESLPSSDTRLVWYRLRFSRSDLKSLSDSAVSTSTHADPLRSFSLYLGTMGRGQTWVNGRAIGRHWNKEAKVTERCAVTCPETGEFYAERCPTNCGKPSQRWYHVPYDWVVDEEGAEEVEVVVFEEAGGDPKGIYFVALAG
ncbi:Beta-galactosidase 6 [Irineochytrium annulatum]|nr:Beta-galactosidase 6 [Irineochytrium annulatum]